MESIKTVMGVETSEPSGAFSTIIGLVNSPLPTNGTFTNRHDVYINGILQNKTAQLEKYEMNGTIPWENQEAMSELMAQWGKLQNLPRLSSLLFIVAHVALWLGVILLRYPLWQVVATCAIVEAPQTVIGDSRPRDEKKHDDERDYSNIVTQQRSTTSSLRAALASLYRLGGVASFYRGAAIYYCIELTSGPIMASLIFTMNIFVPGKPILDAPDTAAFTVPKSAVASAVMELVAVLASNLLLCSWMTAHTHIVITQPTLRIWYRRLPPWGKTLKSTWLPILVELIAYHITFKLPYIVLHKAGLYGLPFETKYLGSSAIGNALILRRLSFAAVWLVAQVARVELLIPAQIATVRVQTSLLPDDEDTIIPVDRTFSAPAGREGAGFVPPGILAPRRGAISFKSAWRSYDWAERKRILFLYAKFMLMEAGVLAAFSIVIGKDVWPGFWHPAP